LQFPLTFWDISLWLAITAIILLITAQILSTHHEEIAPIIDRKRLRTVALILTLLFLAAVIIRMTEVIITLP